MKINFIRHKFNAVSVKDPEAGFFASKKEYGYYQELLLRQKAGEVIFFLRQTPLHLPGNAKYVVDFVEFRADGTVHFVEVKGRDLPMGKLKRKIAESVYPIKIEVV